MPIDIVIIGGPTASGKSAYALKIAQECNGEIINADSMQLYSPLRLLTACPSDEDSQKVPHHLYRVLSGQDDQIGSVAWWQQQAVHLIQEIHSRGKLPIIVGGTGLYLSSLTKGLSSVPSIPEGIRQQVRLMAEKIGFPDFFQYACSLDPSLAKRLKPHDRQRLIRAVEVFLATGSSITYWQGTAVPPLDLNIDFRVMSCPRDELYQRIDQRFCHMVEEGAIQEVQSLLSLALPSSSPILKALGVPELKKYLEGEWSLEQAIEHAQQSSRQYAKRQLTWFRNQEPTAQWVT